MNNARFNGVDLIVTGAALQASAALSRTAHTATRRTAANINMACGGWVTLIYSKPGMVKLTTGMNAMVRPWR